jgi:hypothetical protein
VYTLTSKDFASTERSIAGFLIARLRVCIDRGVPVVYVLLTIGVIQIIWLLVSMTHEAIYMPEFMPGVHSVPTKPKSLVVLFGKVIENILANAMSPDDPPLTYVKSN